MKARRLIGPLIPLLIAGGALAAMYLGARADPVVRRASLVVPGLTRPVTVALIGDIHLGTPVMDTDRLARIVARVDALAPDLVVIAGDFVAGEAPGSAAAIAPGLTAPLARLRAPLGTVAVLGNHDHWTGAAAVRAALARAGVTVIANGAAVRGALAVGGIDDDYTGHADVGATMRAVRAMGRPAILVSHSPDVAPALPPDARVLLAGHTHCGQARLLGIGIAPEVSRFGDRYRCGIVREGARTVVVTAGLGTSGAPLRLGAPPDLWLLTLRGR